MTKQITIRGTVYPSQKAAADALGVKPATISAAAQAGTLDFVGLGPARGERKASASRRPVTIGGATYASRAEAAKALGIAPGAIGAALRIIAPPPPVTIGGRTFATVKDAAAALGATPAQIKAYIFVQDALLRLD